MRELALDRLEDVVCLVASVGEPRDRRPDDPLRIGVELVHRRSHPLPAVARAELVDACAREPLGRELGAEVAEALLGIPHLRDEALENGVVQAGRRDDNALVGERAREGGHAARLDPADVGVVGARDGEAEGGARDERDVRQVRAAGVRVIEDVRVVGAGVLAPDGGDRVRHRAEVDGNVLGLRDQPAAAVEERGRAVAPLLDVGREGRADQDGAHLLGDGAESAAQNLELDVHAFVTPWSASTWDHP